MDIPNSFQIKAEGEDINSVLSVELKDVGGTVKPLNHNRDVYTSLIDLAKSQSVKITRGK
jgi:hypothetical protein